MAFVFGPSGVVVDDAFADSDRSLDVAEEGHWPFVAVVVAAASFAFQVLVGFGGLAVAVVDRASL